MTEVQKGLLSLLSKSLFGKDTTIDTCADWDALCQEARSQAVDLIAINSIDPTQIPESASKKWEGPIASILMANFKVLHYHTLVHEWMTKAGIPYVVLKGFSSAYYYPTPGFRTMGDVDFLVPEKHLQEVCSILEKEGFKRRNENHPTHIMFRKKGIHLEVHFDVAGIPNGECGKKIRHYFDTVYDDASLQKIRAEEAIVPSRFHHGLILLLHTIHHLTGEGIGLRHLCDWAVFVNRLSADEFERLFKEKLRNVGLWKFAQILTRASITYVGAEERTWATADERVVDKLMEDILGSGNFGKKDKSRAEQARLISSRGKNGVGRTSSVKQLILSMNDVLFLKWPITKKNKILLPAGWAYLIMRRVILIICRKRRFNNPVRLIQAADSRKEIYKRLELFEKMER